MASIKKLKDFVPYSEYLNVCLQACNGNKEIAKERALTMLKEHYGSVKDYNKLANQYVAKNGAGRKLKSPLLSDGELSDEEREAREKLSEMGKEFHTEMVKATNGKWTYAQSVKFAESKADEKLSSDDTEDDDYEDEDDNDEGIEEE